MYIRYTISLIALALSSTVLSQDLNTNYLPDLVQAIKIGSVECQNACADFKAGIETCLNLEDTSDIALATCSCTTSFLASISGCGICLDALNGDSAGFNSYTGYFNQCQGVGLQRAENLVLPSNSNPASSTAPTSSSVNSDSNVTSPSTPTTTSYDSSSIASSSSNSSISLTVSIIPTSTSATSNSTSTSVRPSQTLISCAKSLGVKFIGMIVLGAIVSIIL